jgi:hypothetical protein
LHHISAKITDAVKNDKTVKLDRLSKRNIIWMEEETIDNPHE